nr:MAG TPA_asm: Loader and inhibitor of phage G40P [Caudoviricetes sp.]
MKMTKQDLSELLKIIKINYQNFSMDKDLTNYWFECVKDYSYEEVADKLAEHLENDEYNDIPKAKQLTRFLMTEDEKLKKEQAYKGLLVACGLCGEWMDLNNYQNHYAKCLDISYLIMVSKRLGTPITRQELAELSDWKIKKLCEKYKPDENVKIGRKH